MKLIQILALATAMATMATAQNSSTNGQTSGAAKPSPTPASATASSKAKAPAKKTAPKPAAATNSQASAKPAAHSATLPGKPAVKTTSAPVKQAGKAPQSAPVKVKAASAPVIAAKTGTQATNTNKGAKPAVIAAKPAHVTAAKPAPVTAAKPAHVTAAKKTSTQAKKASAKPATPTPKVTQVGTAAPEKPKPVTRVFGPRGRRDPFVSPIRTGSANNGPSPNCTTGKRCLAIPELVLQGTVKDTTGKMLAVVANSTKKTYFLRENDQVFNGSVEKITSDSIIFREFVKDAL
ncbi:MAG TPA: hypothetical protein VJW55_18855, partial [Candidatus Angelobacter sp.]|nr:hypothetical protein [Candidatus Angelobacter sp.]